MLPQRVLLMVLSLGFAAATSAQDMIGLSNIYSSSVFQQGVIAMGKPTLEAGRKAYAGSTSQDANNPADSSARISPNALTKVLEYKPSSIISQSVRSELRTHLIRTNASPEFQAEIKRALSTDAIWQEFDRLLKSYGYSSRNLADVMAAYYICGWEIVHKQEVQPRQFKAIRNQLALTLANSPDIRRLSDAEKQRTAEAMGIMTAIAGAGSQELLKQNDRQGFAELQQAVYQSFSQQGIDLKKLKLTEDGFVMG